MGEFTTCTDCDGDGMDPEQAPCTICMGTGALPVRGLIPGILKHVVDVEDTLSALEAWCITVNQKLAYLKEKIDAL